MLANRRSTPPLKSLVLALLLCGIGGLTVTPVHAQQPSEPEATPLQAGAWALQFAAGQDFTLDSFLGSTISAKRHTSAVRAWQLGLTLAASVENREEGANSETTDLQSLRATARYLAYPLLGEQDLETVQLHVGAGPLFAFRRTSMESGTSWRLGLGVSGTIGVEWFVHPRIGLHGAYESSLRYVHDRSESGGEDNPDTIANEVRLHAVGTRLGVSVYF